MCFSQAQTTVQGVQKLEELCGRPAMTLWDHCGTVNQLLQPGKKQ